MYNPLRIDPFEIRIPDYKAIRARLRNGRPRNGMEAVQKYKVAYSSEDGPVPFIPLIKREEIAPASEAAPVSESEHAPLITPRAKTTEILRIVAEYHAVSIPEMKSPRRTAVLVRARQEAYYRLLHERPDLSYPAIGRLMNRDHTTVLYGAQRYADFHGLPPVVRS